MARLEAGSEEEERRRRMRFTPLSKEALFVLVFAVLTPC